VLEHRATTARAAKQDTIFRITNLQGNKQGNQIEQDVLERARISAGRRDLSLATTERLGRLLSWIGYVDFSGLQVFGTGFTPNSCAIREGGT